MAAPTVFERTLCDKLGFVWIKLVERNSLSVRLRVHLSLSERLDISSICMSKALPWGELRVSGERDVNTN